MKELSLAEFLTLIAVEEAVTKAMLLKPRWRKIIPIHQEVELIADFYALIDYTADNHQEIQTLVITPSAVFFSKHNTKALIQHHLRHGIFDLAHVRQLKTVLHFSHNRELSLCFGNWVAMHLSGVSSSHCADWVGLHHVQQAYPYAERQREFVFMTGLRLVLPVQRDFEARLANLALMSGLQITAVELVLTTMGLKLSPQPKPANILRAYDWQHQQYYARVNAAAVRQYFQSFEDHILDEIAHQPEFKSAVHLFVDFKAFFRRRLQRHHFLN